MLAWGEILFASQLTDNQTATLAIGLQNYATQTDVYWNQIMAASLMGSVPVVIAFLALQRFFCGRPDRRLGQITSGATR